MPEQTQRKETELIADQLRRFYEGLSWLGPSLKELLKDVDEEKAKRRPLPEAHTIWELVMHITTWLRVARERMSATQDLDPTPNQNWPKMEGKWEDALSALEAEVNELEKAILTLPQNRLHQRAPAEEPQTFYVLLHGVIQHSAYHAGQIMLLKKA